MRPPGPSRPKRTRILSAPAASPNSGVHELNAFEARRWAGPSCVASSGPTFIVRYFGDFAFDIKFSFGERRDPSRSAGWTTYMAVPAEVSIRNRLLAALLPADFSLLEPQLERLPLPASTRLIEPNTPIEHVYFLEEGIASVVAATLQDRRIEVGIIGREGMTGLPILLGADRAPRECFIQTSGEGLRI